MEAGTFSMDLKCLMDFGCCTQCHVPGKCCCAGELLLLGPLLCIGSVLSPKTHGCHQGEMSLQALVAAPWSILPWDEVDTKPKSVPDARLSPFPHPSTHIPHPHCHH